MSRLDARRLPEVDRLRGLVMVLMALDHMRDFFDADAMRFSPTNLSRTYPLLFLTRFVTHFCAPTFALLAGVGAYLYGANIRDRGRLSQFLATRGVWLILLDAVIVSPIWAGAVGRIELGALWAIGCGLLALAVLSWLPVGVVLTIALAIICGHNLFDGIHAADLGALGPWWRLLHERGPLPLDLPGRVHYPALPWIGVVALGYAIGPVFLRPAAERDQILRRGAAAALALFLALRAANGYGDPLPWAPQKDALFTALSFLNLTKYPPSLDFLLVTLSGAALALPLLQRIAGALGAMLEIFGRTPLFFYVLHLYVGLAAAIGLTLARGYTLADLEVVMKSGAPPPDFGVGLGGAYLAWIAIVLALYPICGWFAALKARRRDLPFLRYL